MAPISNTERKCRYLTKLKLRKPQFDQGKRQPMGKKWRGEKKPPWLMTSDKLSQALANYYHTTLFRGTAEPF